MREKLTKNTIIAENLNTLLTVIDRANKQKTSTELAALSLNDADQMYITDI